MGREGGEGHRSCKAIGKPSRQGLVGRADVREKRMLGLEKGLGQELGQG